MRITSTSGRRARAALSSSWPSIPGIIRSVTITLTSPLRRTSRASSPLFTASVSSPSFWKIFDTDSRLA